jgi:tetratricopeptide (TPR) repeat protein
VLCKWCERPCQRVEEQGNGYEAKRKLACSVENYQQCIALLRLEEQKANQCSLRRNTLKKKLATFSNNLSYQLNRMGRFEEALVMVEQGIELKEQGLVDFGALAPSYGEKSQILAALGRFQEALCFDEKARGEVKRCADTGERMSQEEIWIYQVNQGRLYLRLGYLDEAEQILREALPQIHVRRKIYGMFAKEALMEIEQMRRSAHPHQLDWRWVERYRELDAYDAYWWWAHTGPFTEEEQQQWDRLFIPNLDAATKSQLSVLLARSRDREIDAALAERREPRLRYPAIDIEEVRRRIDGFLQLDADIEQHEPNAIVRRLYRGTIEDELCFIRAIEATYEGESERFWSLNCQLNSPPTREEMNFALSRVRQIVIQGLQQAKTKDVSERVLQVLHEQFQLSLDLLPEKDPSLLIPVNEVEADSDNKRTLSAQAVKRFFETVLQEGDFDGWRIVLDPNSSGARIDSALKTLFLEDAPMSLETVRDYFIHELLGHVLRSVAGERSALGLLGINTKGYAPTEEGLAQYHERVIATQRGEAFNDSGTWFGGLAVGLASGVVTPPQTFSSLYTFFDPFIMLCRLMWNYDTDRQTAEPRARTRAITRCLRTFRGVPDLTRAGICYTRDVVYLRGRLKIEGAIAQDEAVLDRLAVGKVALELLPDLEELGITASTQSLRKRAYDPDLDAYILSFESSGVQPDKEK